MVGRRVDVTAGGGDGTLSALGSSPSSDFTSCSENDGGSSVMPSKEFSVVTRSFSFFSQSDLMFFGSAATLGEGESIA